jgi:hypothetical protein
MNGRMKHYVSSKLSFVLISALAAGFGHADPVTAEDDAEIYTPPEPDGSWTGNGKCAAGHDL